MVRTGVFATSDCEAVGEGLLAQPVNTISSLAFVVAGTWVLWRGLAAPTGGRLPTVGALGITVGIGSSTFHGFGGRAALLLHDGSLVALLGVLVAFNVDDLAATRPGTGRWWRWPTTFTAGLIVSVAAISRTAMATNIVTGALVGGLVGTELLLARGRPADRRRRWLRRASVLLCAVALVVYALGRTGAPWCDPASAVQPHAAWHVLLAAALAMWADATWGRDRTP